MSYAARPLIERFWEKVDTTGTCWPWAGQRNLAGYGRMFGGPGRGMLLAHRIAYELLVGPIPEGLPIDHLCRVRACVNPAHLEPVTVRENNLRGVGFAAVNAAKSHCLRGHPLSGPNVYTRRDGRADRMCRECMRANRRVSYRRTADARKAAA